MKKIILHLVFLSALILPASKLLFAQVNIISDGSWKAIPDYSAGWETTSYNDATWPYVSAPAPNGCTQVIPGTQSMWFWDPDPSFTQVYFRKTFSITSIDPQVTAEITADNNFSLYVNGVHVGDGYYWFVFYNFDITPYLVIGQNVIAIEATNNGDETCALVTFKALGCTAGITYYQDGDGDGYGNPNAGIVSCLNPLTGYTDDGTDCNDANILVHPGATEACNAIDDNCNGQVDEGFLLNTYYIDADGDGYGGGDAVLACSQPAGTSLNNIDCNDGVASIHPFTNDICNGVDDDCNGIVDDHAFTATISPAGTVTVCVGSTVLLSASGGANISYQWYRNSNLISGATSQSFNATLAGGYSVKEINGQYACTSLSAITNISINNLPAATVTPVGSTDLCVHTPILLKANTGSGLTYQWVNGTTNITGATGVTYLVTVVGNYKVIVTKVSTGCSRTSAAVAIVKNVPVATITPLGSLIICTHTTVVLQANSGTGYTYQWTVNNSSIGGATNQNYTASATGLYKVIVTSGGCSTTSSAVHVLKKACKEGLTMDNEDNPQLNLYPNPADGKFIIDLKIPEGLMADNEEVNNDAFLEIINTIGRVVYTESFTITEGELIQEISPDQSFAGGLYLVRVKIKDRVYSGQLVYQK